MRLMKMEVLTVEIAFKVTMEPNELLNLDLVEFNSTVLKCNSSNLRIK